MNAVDNSYSNILNQESEGRLETKTDQDEIALIIDDMVQRVIKQNTSELRQRVHDRNISIRERLGMPPSKANSLKEHTAEEGEVLRQQLLKQIHDRNISIRERLGMPPSKADPLKEHTAEESAVFRQEILKQVHDRNISTKNRIDKMADQDFGIKYNQSQTSDGPSEINKKMCRAVLIGSFGAGGIAALVSAFVLGPIGILVVFVVAGILGGFGGFLFSKN